MLKLTNVIVFGCCIFLSQAFTFSQTGEQCDHGVMSLQRIRQVQTCIPSVVRFHNRGEICEYVRDLGRPICDQLRQLRQHSKFICDLPSNSLSCTTTTLPLTTSTLPTTTTLPTSPTSMTTSNSQMTTCRPCLPCNQVTSESSLRRYSWNEVLQTRK